MAQAKAGDTVKVHYTGKLENGNVFDSSRERAPVEFIIGQQKLIPMFEQAIIDMAPGATKTISIPHEKAYGPHRPEMVLAVGRDKIPADINPKVGEMLRFQKEPAPGKKEGETVVFTVAEIAKDHLKLDANHPLAGKDLIFDLELVEIIS